MADETKREGESGTTGGAGRNGTSSDELFLFDEAGVRRAPREDEEADLSFLEGSRAADDVTNPNIHMGVQREGITLDGGLTDGGIGDASGAAGKSGNGDSGDSLAGGQDADDTAGDGVARAGATGANESVSSNADVDPSPAPESLVEDRPDIARAGSDFNNAAISGASAPDVRTAAAEPVQSGTTASGLSASDEALLAADSTPEANRAPTGIELSNASLAENTPGAVVGALTTADTVGDTHSYTVDDGRFEIVTDGETTVLKLKPGMSLDHEAEPNVDVTVTTTDSGGAAYTETFTLSVGDVNEGPSDITLDNLSVAENAAGAVVGMLSTTDVDAGDAHTYAVDDARFEVVDGQLKLKDGVSLDHETEASVDVTVTTTDTGGATYTETFTLSVGDVNEGPSDITLDNLSVAENAAGAVVGMLSTTDVDAGDSHTYAVDDARFEVVDGQLKLKDGVSLDHETEASVDVTVTTTDTGGATYTETFTLSVGDVNEGPSDITLDNLSVAENAAGAVVGMLSTTDVDAGDSHTYAVDDARFEVVDGQLKLKDGVSLDHEAESSVDVTVTTTDSGGATYTETFTLSVGDVNEGPSDISLSNNSVAENAAGAVVGTLSTADVDAGDAHTYAVDDARFEVVDGQLKLKDGVSLDHEAEPNVDVTVTTTDTGGATYTETFSIAVGDVNEGPSDISLSNNSVAENAAGAVVGMLSTTDVDAGDSHTYAVDDARFEVVDGQLKLKDGVSLDHETEASVDVTVTTTDSGGATYTETFTLSVGDVNEGPSDISLSNNSVAENAAGAVVGTLSTTDVDAGDAHTYAVDDARFEVVGGQLKLKDGVSLDHESESSVDVTVTTTDSGGATYTETFTLSVGDVNEGPSDISLSNNTVAENAAGAVVGALTTTDVDAGDAHTYAVDDARFEVADGQLKLKDGVSLDHEAEPNVDVTVTTTDTGGATYTETFSIAVGDVNEGPSDISLSNNSVAENAAGAVVGTLSTTDVDAGDAHTYAVDDARFEVVDGQLKLKDGVSLDHETEASVDVTVTTTDTGGAAYTETFTLSVGDVNEGPSDITLDNLSVAENAAGAVVGMLSTTDVDAGDSHTYAVDDARFEVVDGQLKLKDGVSLDHETEASVDVTVTTTDTGGATYTETFTLSVGDVNEGPSDITLDNLSVAENAAGAVVGMLSTTDVDAGDSHTYAVDDARFEVVDGQLKLKDGVSLDHEAESSVDVTVTTTDSGGATYTETFTLSVGDVNEGPSDISLSNNSVAENAAGAVVGTLSTADVDAGDAHTYAVDDARFEVVDGQLKLKDGVSLDHEAEPNVDVTVTTTDTGGATYTETFSIAVGDVNEGPSDISLSNNSVAENAAGAVVGMLSTTDVDAGDSHTYAVDDARFEVVDGQLKLKDGVSLDHETEASVDVTVTTTDSGGATYTETFTLSVGDVNEGPSDISLSNNSVAENAAGAVVGTLSTTDVDAGDAHTYAVDDARFEVVGGQLKLKDGVSLDHESESSVDVTVTTTDSGGATYTETFTLSVGDVNEGPSDISLSNNTVAENAAGAVVGALTTTDVDAGDAHTYAVDDARFEVADGQLKLKDGVSLDHEAEPNVDVTVTTTDTGGATYTETFSIAVGDVNEGPSDISLSNNSVAENAAGAVVGTLSTTDVDAGDAHTYAVDDARFEVVDGQLKLKDGVSLDHETEASVDVTVTTTDTGGAAYTETFTLSVGDVNEGPSDITLDNLSVAENAAGAVVGTLSTTDVDAGDSHAYAVDDARFEVVDGQLKLKDGVSLDHEAESSVDVTVTTTDSGGATYTETFSIAVGDVNEGPSDITLDNLSVAENAAGAVVGMLSTTDVDAGDSHTYAVDDARFEVVDGQLKLKDGVSLDHEAESSVDVTVTTTDSGGATYTETFTLSVGDVNEGPSDISLSNNSVAENAAGAVVGTLSTADVDAGDAHTYAVDDARFEVVDGQLKLKDGVSLDHEAEPNVDVTVTTTDTGGATYTETFSIAVGDVNEGPSDISLSNNSVAENAAGAVVGMLSTTDVDAGDSHTYAVDDARFEVVDGQLKLKDGVSLDHETEASVDVTVTTTDSGGATYTETFTLSVGDVNEGPSDISLSNNSVAENAAGAVVGTLSTTDVDAGDAHTYAVDDARFEVVGGQLKLKDGVSLDHESESSVDVTVTTTDSGGATYTETFTLSVGDVNEGPSDISLSNNTVAENAAGAVVGALTTTDVDAGDAHTYAVDDARFEVADGQLKLKDGVSLDHEAEPNVDVTVTTTDTGGATYTETFSIAVGDVNEGPSDISLSNNSVAENAAGAVVGTLSTTDVDAGDAHTYAVDDARFEVVDGQLKLKDGVSLDHETEASVDVTVTTTDTGGAAYTETFTLSVGDVNEGPSDITLDNLSVAENAAGAVVGTLSTTDVDAGDSHAYAVDDARFEVVDGQLKLKDGVSLDHEAESSVDVTVTTTDSGGATYTETFSIAVGDVNEGPADISLSNNTVAENAAGAVVGTLSTTDVDAGDAHTYAVDDARFEVVDGQLKLKDGVSLDHETEASVDVTVTTTDTGGATYTETFSIAVGDVNEGPSDISLSNHSVAENAAGAVVGTLSTTDVDAGDAHTYAVDDARFEVADGQLKLKDGVSLDHETEASVDVTVTTTDTGGATYTETFSIAVGDVNEAPTDIDLTGTDTTTVTLTFQSESAGYGNSLGVYYKDADGNPVAGEIVWADGNDLTAGETASVSFDGVDAENIGYFLIPNGGNENPGLSAGTAVTFVQDGDGNWQAVTDGGVPLVGTDANVFFSGGADLNADGLDHTVENGDQIGFEDLIDNGDHDFSDIVFTTDVQQTEALTVNENDAGAVVGTLSATDVDAGDSHIYTVDDDRFEVIDGQLKLKDGVSLNYEAEPSVDVAVTATDTGGAAYTETFTVSVADIAEAPVVLWNEDFSGLWNGTTSDAGDTAWSASDAGADITGNHGVRYGAYEFGRTTDDAWDSTSKVTWQSEAIDISGQSHLDLSFSLSETGDMEESGAWQDTFRAFAVIDGVRTELMAQEGDSGIADVYSFQDIGQGSTLVIEFEAKTTDDSERFRLDDIKLVGHDGAGSPTELTVIADPGDAMPTLSNATYTADDDYEGSDGNDTIIYNGLDDDNKLDGEEGNDILVDDNTDGEIKGDDGDDTLYGRGGDDVLKGDKGNDTLYGGSGNDKLEGKDGDDILVGGLGDDYMKGGKGDDILFGGAGDDTLKGEDGSDLFIFQTGNGDTDTVYGGSGSSWTDTIQLQGSDGGYLETDWTLTLDHGAIEASDIGSYDLSEDAAGTITFADGSEISFDGIERIEW